MKLSKNKAKNLFLALILVNILFALAILGVFTIASNAADKKSQKIAQEKADVQSNDQVIADYKILQETLKTNKDLETVVQDVLPQNKDQSEAFADLDKFSKTSNFPLQQINFDTGTNKGVGQSLTSPSDIKGVSTLIVQLHSNNTQYNNLLAFLKQIETTQRLMQATSITITPNSTTPNVLDHVDLTVNIYFKSGS